MTEESRGFVEARGAITQDGRTLTVELTAPYTFVPLSDVILSSPLYDGGSGPDHGRPIPCGLSGEIEVEWIFDQPVLVGGSRGEEGSSFASLPDEEGRNVPVIPGGTVRGLVRSLLEVATSARMTHVDADAHYGVRDFNDPHYKAHGPLPTNPHLVVEAGWLVNDELRGKGDRVSRRPKAGGWRLFPVPRVALHTAELLARRRSPMTRQDFEALSVAGKYQRFPGDPPAGIPKIRYRNDGGRASLDSTNEEGFLVFTGIDPQRDDHMKSKKRCYIFALPDPDDDGIPIVDEGLMARFISLHTSIARGRADQPAPGAWDYWIERWRDAPPRAGTQDSFPGIPVFIVRDNKRHPSLKVALAKACRPEELYLSLSRFIKVPHAFSVGDLRPEAHRNRQRDTLDFVEALFGMVPPEVKQHRGSRGEQEEAFKGRVFFRHATLEGTTPPVQPEAGVTSTPRPSFWPYYLVPTDGVAEADTRPLDYSHAKARLAGWKRYPVRGQHGRFPVAENDAMQSKMNFLQASPDRPMIFRGPIRLHNVHPIEFGALLWAISFAAADGTGATPSCFRHAIGRGKAQGFGRARGHVRDLSRLVRNDGKGPHDPVAYVEAFETWLVGAWNAAHPEETQAHRLADIPAIADLMAIGDPAIGDSVAARLVYPTSRHTKSPEETPSLAGYRLVKETARQMAGNPQTRRRKVLPSYPRRPIVP